VHGLIYFATISQQDLKNIPNIVLMLVGKTQRNQLIYFTHISNNIQIRAIPMHTPGAPIFPCTPPKYSSNVCHGCGLNTNWIALM
jgi:hypothetical protein